jgi:hypothetical protein
MRILKIPAWALIVGALAGYWFYDAMTRNKFSSNNPLGG